MTGSSDSGFVLLDALLAISLSSILLLGVATLLRTSHRIDAEIGLAIEKYQSQENLRSRWAADVAAASAVSQPNGREIRLHLFENNAVFYVLETGGLFRKDGVSESLLLPRAVSLDLVSESSGDGIFWARSLSLRVEPDGERFLTFPTSLPVLKAEERP